MRISDWSSDVCSSDLDPEPFRELAALVEIEAALAGLHQLERRALHQDQLGIGVLLERPGELVWIVAVEEQEIGAKADAVERIDLRASGIDQLAFCPTDIGSERNRRIERSERDTSELQ